MLLLVLLKLLLLFVVAAVAVASNFGNSEIEKYEVSYYCKAFKLIAEVRKC